MTRWKAEEKIERYCAGCGEWRNIYIAHRDPRRSLCQTCYIDGEIRHKFGKGYMGPDATPPHPNVEMWFEQPWGKEWIEKHGHKLANFTRNKPTLVYNPQERAKIKAPWELDPVERARKRAQ